MFVSTGLATEFKSRTTPTKTGGRWAALLCSNFYPLNISKALLFALSAKSFTTINIQISIEWIVRQPMFNASPCLGKLRANLFRDNESEA